MIKILALDLATKTGWATNEGMLSGVQVFATRRGESPGMRFLKCRGWLRGMLGRIDGLEMIIYEQAHHRGGSATEVAVGLVTTVQLIAAEKGIELMPVHTGELKRWATGKGNAGKELMVAAAVARGWNPEDDNEADAALLLEYGMELVGESKPAA